ncbi:imelysin family protein [Stagnihabitans tardus]|uniref:Signal peptidase n=1 Tax=Stagnihabitans tardus TaxID=2699202 RepID=A0AAE4YBU6_9RHOB|nr:imelysin family protein [Stagnihabitans tardus]NBZ88802.1 signal peptidase [Stagnihabitans tardus]
MRALLLTLALLAAPARADIAEAVQDHILPGMAKLQASAETLRDAGNTCDTKALQDGFHATYDAWMAVQHLHLGPTEEEGRGLAVLYWPDPKGMGAKAQMALLKGDPAKLEPEAFAEQSVAARGLLALERLIYPEKPLPADPCPLIAATTADLARVTGEIAAGWQDYAQLLTTAGEPGNTAFLSRTEARQALFTQLAAGLETLNDGRIGRPLGSFEAPHPERAEARASGRSLRNITLALSALRDFTESLTPDAPQTLAAFDAAIAQAEAMDDPILAGITEPQGRLKLEILAQSVTRLRELALSEVAPEMDVGIGFNSADGD